MMPARRQDLPAALPDWVPPVRGTMTVDAPIAPLIWFRTGGPAALLFEPADLADLVQVLRACPPSLPILPLGLGSNLIIRDGGFPGLVIRLGKPFARIIAEGLRLRCGGGAPGIAVASAARDAGIAGVEFLRGIPGTIGGAVRMNAGAYGREMANVLIECTVLSRRGDVMTLPAETLGYSYRHSELAAGSIVVDALIEGHAGDPALVAAEMDRIAAEREASQPLRSRTGGSTFKNPPGLKAWELIDQAGCRGLTRGGAQVSEKHCNFLINTDGTSAADLEALGEEVRQRVLAQSGVALQWEIDRIGEVMP
jgi:UDP-N-acetylmuramate dehydrogenase